jgi:hypothetical protein
MTRSERAGKADEARTRQTYNALTFLSYTSVDVLALQESSTVCVEVPVPVSGAFSVGCAES